MSKFPSPYGAWVVTLNDRALDVSLAFPSPYGAWVVTWQSLYGITDELVSVPLRGMGCDDTEKFMKQATYTFPSPYGAWVVTCFHV